MSEDLDGKVAIVTGASTGQGAEEARLLIARRARVVLADIDTVRGESLADELGHQAFFQRHDVADPHSWTDIVAATLDRYGRIDALVNNAAIYAPMCLQDTSPDDFDRFYRINQRGVFLGMKAVIEPMTRGDGGAIVNIGSAAGLRGRPSLFPYATSKWALRGMTRCAAHDLAPLGIRVNAILPGIIDTEMYRANTAERRALLEAPIPLGRIGQPDDVAGAVVFLISDAARYISGAEIAIDGALTA